MIYKFAVSFVVTPDFSESSLQPTSAGGWERGYKEPRQDFQYQNVWMNPRGGHSSRFLKGYMGRSVIATGQLALKVKHKGIKLVSHMIMSKRACLSSSYPCTLRNF